MDSYYIAVSMMEKKNGCPLNGKERQCKPIRTRPKKEKKRRKKKKGRRRGKRKLQNPHKRQIQKPPENQRRMYKNRPTHSFIIQALPHKSGHVYPAHITQRVVE